LDHNVSELTNWQLLTLGGGLIATWALVSLLFPPESPAEKEKPAETKVPVEPTPSGKKGSKASKKKSTPVAVVATPAPEPAAKSTAESMLQPRIIACGLLLPMLPVILPYLAAPMPYPQPMPFTLPDHPLRILSSVQSRTGRVVVGDMLPTIDSAITSSSRFLRVSHSLLGGVWTGEKVASKNKKPMNKDMRGEPLGDSIYSTFVLQEAARLVNSTKKAKAGKFENALIMCVKGYAVTSSRVY
jgi:hypothetical protein